VKLYFSGLGGEHSFLFFLAFAGGIILSEFLFTGQTWYLGHWASQYDDRMGSDVDVVQFVHFPLTHSALTGFLQPPRNLRYTSSSFSFCVYERCEQDFCYSPPWLSFSRPVWCTYLEL
jgi:hypothetical protein